MAVIAVQNVDINGGANPVQAYAAAVGPDTIFNDGKDTFLHVKNGSGSPTTVTIDDTGSVPPPGAKSFDGDIDVVIAAGDEALIRLGNRQRFGGDVTVNYSATTTITVAGFRLL